MPALKNPKHEIFAQGLAKGLTLDAAYVAAGYKKHRPNAHRMRTNENILRRIAEIQAPILERTFWDAEARITMLRDTANRAYKDKDHRGVIAAIAESNKMEGTYRPSPAQQADANQANALAILLTNIIAARPALPIGAQRPAPRGVDDKEGKEDQLDSTGHSRMADPTRKGPG